MYCLDPDVSKSSIVPKLTVTLISNLHISYMYMSNKAESRVLLEKYEHLLNKTILVYQVRLGEETWSMAAQETLHIRGRCMSLAHYRGVIRTTTAPHTSSVDTQTHRRTHKHACASDKLSPQRCRTQRLVCSQHSC